MNNSNNSNSNSPSTDNCNDTGAEVALLYSIRRTDHWWQYVGKSMSYSASYSVSDIRGDGDFNLVDDFYVHQKRYYHGPITPSTLLSSEQIEDIIARCRLLRFLPFRLARSMILAMAEATTIVLDKSKATAIFSFPIDRYVSDVLRIMGEKRGIEYHELTVGPLPDTVMILNRGRLRLTEKNIEPHLVQKNIDTLVDSYFKPSYVAKKNRFTKGQFWRTFSYFKLRGWAFKAISILRRDPLNLHYNDSQSYLGHKPRFSDHRVIDMVDRQWRAKLDNVAMNRRVFMGLAVFPEAAIDYWIDDLNVVQYENMMVKVANELANNGFHIFIKDHPLQFGFRQAELLDRLLSIKNTVLVPYDVDGKQVIADTDVTITYTGTVGLEAALLGKKVIVTENYYSTSQDFIFIEGEDVSGLAQQVKDFEVPQDLSERQFRIVERLMKGSFTGNFFAFDTYKANTVCNDTIHFSQACKAHVDSLVKPLKPQEA